MRRGIAIVICLCAVAKAAHAQTFSVSASSAVATLELASSRVSNRLQQVSEVFDGARGGRGAAPAVVTAATALPKTAAPAPPPPKPQAPQPAPAVTVRSGDTLTAIAARNGVSLAAVIAANPQIANPNLIHPGETVFLSGNAGAARAAPAPGQTYRIYPGDTLWGISQRTGISVQTLARANAVANPSLIYAGQTLRIPAANDSAPSAPLPLARPAPAVAKPGSDPRVVATAEQWMTQAHVNPDTGNTNWNGYCLGYVNSVTRAATGRSDPGLTEPYAQASYRAMASQGRISTNFSRMPAGAAVYWNTGQYGHIAIFSGQFTASGDPIIVTTGFGSSTAKELPMSQIDRALGPSEGYAAL